MYDFRNLRIWQNARSFVIQIYAETQSFPREERLGLALQMRRAAVSIPSNIAEGCGREGNKSVQQFLSYAIASAFELETQLIIATDLKFISEKKGNELIQNLRGIQKGIHFFKKNLR